MYGDLNLDMHNAPCRKCRFCCEKAAPKESCYSTIHIFHGTIVLFVLSLITLACNLWILKENNEVKIAIAVELYKSSTRTSDNTLSVEDYGEDLTSEFQYRLHKRDVSTSKKRKGRKKPKCKCRGKRGKRGPRGETGSRGEMGIQGVRGELGVQGLNGKQGQPGIQGEKGDPALPPMRPMAAHYTSDFMRDANTSSWNSNVACKMKWHGTVCRNRTYTSLHKHQTVTFLKRSEWSDIDNPFYDKNKGRYKAKKTGIYIVYFHVVFYDNKPKEEIAIIHHRSGRNTDSVLRCVEGVDSHTYGPKIYKNKKMKTCSITSVLHVQKDDEIEIKNMIAGTTIDLTKDATYFGAVLLSETTD